MKRISAIAAALLVVAFALAGCASSGPSGPGWTTLIDGENGLQNFTRLGEANWTASGGSIWADKKTSKDAGILLSKESYTDFEVYAEFWADEEQRHLHPRDEPESRQHESCVRSSDLG